MAKRGQPFTRPTPEQQCTAKSQQSGKRCQRYRAPGLDKCQLHCGLSRAKRLQIAAETEARAAAEKAVITYGLPRDVSPAEALLEEVRYTAGHVAWLREQVQSMDAENLVWGETERTEKGATEFPGTDIVSSARASVWLDLYYRERKHLVDVTKAALAAGIEERRVRIAESQGAVFVQVIKAILGDLRLTAEQQGMVASVVPRHLRAIAS